jgi:hypothetical protein
MILSPYAAHSKEALPPPYAVEESMLYH